MTSWIFDAADPGRGAGDALNQPVGHDGALAPFISGGLQGVGVPGQRRVRGDALGDGQQGCQQGHGVRRRAQA